ncbi:hypothetical protein [Mycobacterium sp. 1164966.3]|uniref:hypothetical protein n=1 Tax=Mycobacterium sp. 1164966.3 TaxID=1856861 RepID=UPI001561A7DD|nr:hypothetical protein [Mycobacterium sp. 1164966.3]
MIELFVIDVSEYRNTAKRGSRIRRAPLGGLLYGAHGVRFLHNTLALGQVAGRDVFDLGARRDQRVEIAVG